MAEQLPACQKSGGLESGLAVVLGVEVGSQLLAQQSRIRPMGWKSPSFTTIPKIDEMTPAEYWKLANRLGLYFGQAHPLRGDNFCHPDDPSILHGMEFYNGHGEHGNHNSKVYELVRSAPGLIGTVGSDFHHPSQLGTTAMLFPSLPRTSSELARLLLDGRIDGYLLKAEKLEDIPAVFQQDSRFRCATIGAR